MYMMCTAYDYNNPVSGKHITGAMMVNVTGALILKFSINRIYA